MCFSPDFTKKNTDLVYNKAKNRSKPAPMGNFRSNSDSLHHFTIRNTQQVYNKAKNRSKRAIAIADDRWFKKKSCQNSFFDNSDGQIRIPFMILQ